MADRINTAGSTPFSGIGRVNDEQPVKPRVKNNPQAAPKNQPPPQTPGGPSPFTQAINSGPKPDDMYTQQLADAQNNTDEVTEAATLLTQKRQPNDQPNQGAIETEKVNAKRPTQAEDSNEPEKQANVASAIDENKVEAVSSKVDLQKVTKKHDDLMIKSGQMSIEEVSTMVAKDPADRVIDILSGNFWNRSGDAHTKLMADQISGIPEN
ncbi:hypothetical protein [Epibacterium ulvae]|uniref:hypothetical protein n=1 Tax=Epibacterium ulvae TaxID=1156985 RepID=UPI00249011B7|nr:hypothetical protein [Epibacterium ulvae]